MTLPDLFLFTGDWQCYEDKLYQIYLDEIINAGLSFKGLPIRYRYRPQSKNKHFSFWHLISEGRTETDRTPDLRRCERIRWITYLISQTGIDTDITWWENQRGGNTHTVIWHETANFAVILAKRSNYYLLTTAYNVELPKRRKAFIEERDNFWKARKS